MNYLLKNGTAYIGGKMVKRDLAIIEGSISLSLPTDTSSFVVVDCLNKYIFPGFVDVHVHLREPGFSYKETVKTGTLAGAASGYSAVFTMPNLNPVPDSVENLAVQLDLIKQNWAGGASSLIIGIAILVLGWIAVEIVLLVLGILVAVKGIVALINIIKAGPKNALELVFPILTIVIGAIIAFGNALSILMIIGGILLAVDGVIGLIGALKK